MNKEKIVEEARVVVERDEWEQEVNKVSKLIKKIKETEKLLEAYKTSLDNYLVGKPMLRIEEKSNGDILISNDSSTRNVAAVCISAT